MRSKNYTILLTEIITIILMVFNVLPVEASLFLTGLLIFYFIFSPIEDSLWVFIASIPLFVALPITENFDSMANWRILLAIMFLVLVFRSGPSITSIKNFYNKWKLRENLKHFPMEYLAAVFLLIGFLSLFAANDVWVGVKKLLFLINIFLIFIIIRNLASKNREVIKKIISAVGIALSLSLAIGYIQIISVFFAPLYTFWQYWTKNIIPIFYGQGLSNLLSYSNTWFSYYDGQPPTLRMFSVFPDSHSFALFSIIGLLFLLTAVILRQKGNKKLLIFRYLNLILLLLSLLFSGSRGIWASALALLILLLIFISFPRIIKILFPNFFIRSKFSQIRDAKVFQLVFGSLIIFFLLFPISSWILFESQKAQLKDFTLDEDTLLIFKRAKSITDLSEVSAKTRLQIWEKSLVSMGLYPFLGVGIGNYPVVLDEDVKAAKRGASANNLYLDVASEMGIFALLILLFIFSEIFKTAWRVFQREKESLIKYWAGFFALVLIWILSYSLFDIVLLNDKVLLFFIISLGILYAAAANLNQSTDL